MLNLTRTISLALALAALAPLAQADQKLVPAQSDISFTFKQLGVPVEGHFKRFDAQIAFDPAKPAKEVMTALAKDIMAEPAVVIALGNVPMLEFRELKAAGKACIATLATCADIAISLSPVPACCNPGPAEAIPEPAIAVKPVATAAKVPTKSPSFRSTNILIP